MPCAGKRWVRQLAEHEWELGVSQWTKNYRTGIEPDDLDALTRRYPFYGPITTWPEPGRRWWRENAQKKG